METTYFLIAIGIFSAAFIGVIIWLNNKKSSNQQLVSEAIKGLQSELELKMEILKENQGNLSNTLENKFNANQDLIRNQNSENRKELNQRLDSVNTILRSLNQDLGSVGELSGNMDNLSRILSNTARRGAFGEAQLSAIVADYFAPGQYEENWTVPGTSSRVEMAIKVPRTNGEEIYMPVDSKFNMETFRNYKEAEEAGEETKSYLDAFLNTVKKQVKEVSSKYIKPPFTTEFAMIFIPVESIYQEIMSHHEIVEDAYNNHKVNIVGPTNLLAVLSAYQMGYKQISITENSRKVYDILVAVKQEFEKFEDTLDKAVSQNETVHRTLESLKGTRVRQMKRKLDQTDNIQLSA